MDRCQSRATDVVETVHVLIIVQAAIAIALAIEGALFAAFLGPTVAPSALGGGILAVAMLLLAAGIGRRLRLARRIALIVEIAILLLAVADTALAFVMGTVPPLMVLTTRIGLPVAIIVLLRRPSARSAFGATPRVPPAAPAGIGL
jgi:hypothetical protein